MEGFSTTAGGGLSFATQIVPERQRTVNLYSDWCRLTPRVRNFRPMILDRAASAKVHELSMRPFKEWLPWARPSFDKTFIQIDPRAYIPGDDIIEALVIMCDGESVQMAAQGVLERKETVLTSPFTINFDLDPSHYVPVPETIERLGWGITDDNIKVPRMPRVGGNPSKQLAKLSEAQIAKICREFAGQVRIALAAMALINMHGDFEAVPEQAPRLGRKRSKYHKEFIPVFGVHTVTLDTSKRNRKPKRAGEAGTPKCEHDVRGHFQHRRSELWSACGKRHDWVEVGPRQVCQRCKSTRKWVDGFRRGDPARGSTVARYEIK